MLIFNKILLKINKKRKCFFIFKELFGSLIIIFLIYSFGYEILSIINIKLVILYIFSGIFIFLIAVKIIFSQKKSDYSKNINKNPFMTPLAIPIFVNPSIMMFIIIYSSKIPKDSLNLVNIFLALFFSILIFIFFNIKNIISEKKILYAFEKLIGIFLCMISIEMFFSGLRIFIKFNSGILK